MAAVGGLHLPPPGYKATHAMLAHQALDTATSHLPPVCPPYVAQQRAVLGRTPAFGLGPPSVVACPGTAEDAAKLVDRPGAAAVLDHAEPHLNGPAKIEMDLFEMSRSMRSRSHSRRSRAIPDRCSASGSAA